MDFQPPHDAPLIIDKRWAHPEGTGGFRFTLDDQYRGWCLAWGQGTMVGARAILASMEEALVTVGRDNPLTSLVDIRQVHGSPLRAQYLLGRWLMKNKSVFERVAVFGGPPWEMTLARAIMKMARMSKRVGFYKTQEEAFSYLYGG